MTKPVAELINELDKTASDLEALAENTPVTKTAEENLGNGIGAMDAYMTGISKALGLVE